MNESQRNRIAPHWAVIELAYNEGSWIGGQDALQTMNQVNQELGNAPSSFNCGACVMDLIKLTYNNFKLGQA